MLKALSLTLLTRDGGLRRTVGLLPRGSWQFILPIPQGSMYDNGMYDA